jgi:hypothetical protein
MAWKTAAATCVTGSSLLYRVSSTRPAAIRSDPQPDPLALKITLQFKHLYVVTAYWPEMDVEFVLAPFHLLATKRGKVRSRMFPLDAPVLLTYRVAVELGPLPHAGDTDTGRSI